MNLPLGRYIDYMYIAMCVLCKNGSKRGIFATLRNNFVYFSPLFGLKIGSILVLFEIFYLLLRGETPLPFLYNEREVEDMTIIARQMTVVRESCIPS